MKTYAIDAFWTMSRCYKVKANTQEEAERKVRDELKKIANSLPASSIDLRDYGFEALEEYETEPSGEGIDEDHIKYY